MTEDQIARLAHEANRTYCQMLGDDSHFAWEDAPEWQKRSAIEGVQAIMNNPLMGPEEGHRRWMEHKLKSGWKYGPKKDSERKEHPCLVPYSSLPITQRFKDYLFHSVVVAAMGLEDEWHLIAKP